MRREFRELTERDREAYFAALVAVYSTDTETGKTSYGANFRGREYFVKKHLGAMTLESCTPWHDGEVFVTSHIALNLEFERSLQAVDDSVALHVWDYTLDDTLYGDDWTTKSPMFTSSHFGKYPAFDESSALDAEGYFAGLRMQDASEDDPEQSIYGYRSSADNTDEPRRRRGRDARIVRGDDAAAAG